ncbi:putative transposase and inactivated derivative [Shewanella benthica KT99]|uniref:Putative transposase and inactivated derivative n=1 Tax=Shewanella benthica KT99 TaxID=314608 RepID=A9DAX6_9GAMM|nr:putative transposase and inactivated derivative [Shewanella benthica KT99]EDP99606.1 putative transposase and inactivated derivative [Shewanella benthica KT99]EDQ00512.1 putative transposase and inactivated derivative [Shewanella benthica KT99]
MVPWTSKEAMILHLRQISEVTEADRHAVVIMDGAGCIPMALQMNSIMSASSNYPLIHLSLIRSNKCGAGCASTALPIEFSKIMKTLLIVFVKPGTLSPRVLKE